MAEEEPSPPGLRFVGRIGTGSYGDVFLAVQQDGQRVAVKLVEKALLRDEEMRQRLAKEIEIHSQLRHPHVVSLLRCLEDERRVYLVMENCPGGDVLSVFRRAGRLPEWRARQLFGQLVQAVAYLHSRGVVHRDIKLANLLLTEGGDLKLCDFGLAAALESTDSERHTICGTPNYLSPEIVGHRPYTMATDLWSLGVVLYALVAGHPPFQCETVAETLRRVGRAEYDPAPPGVGPEAADLVGRLLQWDPAARLPLAAVLRHPFLRPTAPRPAAPIPTPSPPAAAGPKGAGAREARGAPGLLEAAGAAALRGSALFRAQGEGGRLPPLDLPRIDTSGLPGPVEHASPGAGLALSVCPRGGVTVSHREGGGAGAVGTFWVSPDGAEVAVRGGGWPGGREAERCGTPPRPQFRVIAFVAGVGRRFATGDLPPSLEAHYKFAADVVAAVVASTPRVVYLGRHEGRATRACLLPDGWVDVTWDKQGGGIAGVRLPPCAGVSGTSGGGGQASGGREEEGEGKGGVPIVTWQDGDGGADALARAIGYAERCRKRCLELERRAGPVGARRGGLAGPIVAARRGSGRPEHVCRV